MQKQLNNLIQLNPTDDQREAWNRVAAFLEDDNNSNVFILKGYAGTGKTTLIEAIIRHLTQRKKKFNVMAPTGAAARILHQKTGFGVTVHRGIYNLDRFETINDEGEDIAKSSFHLHFPIIEESEIGRVCVVDEASMISDKESKNELVTFGTNRLLTDILTYMNISSGYNKLIFVGDPAQLEPVTDNRSNALIEDYFRQKNLNIESYTLTDVVRQQSGSRLLENATKFRKLLDSDIRNDVGLLYGEDVIKLSPLDIVGQYLKEFPQPQLGKGVIINFSNKQCLAYNQKIRSHLFPGCDHVNKDDLLIINKNNYHTHGIDLYNGMAAKVLWASDKTEKQAAPVYVDEGGEQVRKKITLTFRDITLQVLGFDFQFNCKIIDSLLNSPSPGLTVPEMKALYINFKMRFNKLRKTRDKEGKPRIETDSQEFKELIRKDPYYNALHVKYGYAVTCHKAQGGEWDTTFVNFQDRVGIKNAHIRWSYTAMTRASNKMYAINPPEISPLGALNFSQINSLNNLPANIIQYNKVPETPCHSSDAHSAKKLKYFEIEEKLAGTPYSINRVETRNYQEMYYVNCDKNVIRLDAHHDKAGIFKKFSALNDDSSKVKKMEKLFNEPVPLEVTLDYEPSNKVLQKLYNKVLSACNELNIQITNIVEKLENYYVLYYFQVETYFASIKFYINKNNQITKANPKIESMPENNTAGDAFKQLLTKIQN